MFHQRFVFPQIDLVPIVLDLYLSIFTFFGANVNGIVFLLPIPLVHYWSIL